MSPMNSIARRSNELPLITNKDIEEYGIKWAMVDKFGPLLKDRRAIVVNTDVSSGEGIHWIVMIPIDDVVYIVDSLGEETNERQYDDIMFDTIRKRGYNIKFYDGLYQYKDSVLCGYFAIYIALLFNHTPNISLEKAHDIVYKNFGYSSDVNDVRNILNFFHLSV